MNCSLVELKEPLGEERVGSTEGHCGTQLHAGSAPNMNTHKDTYKHTGTHMYIVNSHTHNYKLHGVLIIVTDNNSSLNYSGFKSNILIE